VWFTKLEGIRTVVLQRLEWLNRAQVGFLMVQTPREAMIMMSAICERLEANPEKGDPPAVESPKTAAWPNTAASPEFH